jgi:hypothetical protein
VKLLDLLQKIVIDDLSLAPNGYTTDEYRLLGSQRFG